MLLLRATWSSWRWISAPSDPSSPRPEEITTTAETPALAASSTAARTRAAGTATSATSTWTGTSTSRGKARTPSIDRELGMDDEDVSLEVVGEDRGEDGVPQSRCLPAHADHRDRPWVEQWSQRSRLGDEFAEIGGRHGGRRRCRAHLHAHHAGVEPAGDREPRVGEDADHRGVVGQDLGDEPAHPQVPAGGREVLEQQAAQPPAVLAVRHEEGDLRLLGREPFRGSHRHDRVGDGCHQGGRRVP